MNTILIVSVLVCCVLFIQGVPEVLPAEVNNDTNTVDRSSHLHVNINHKGLWRKKLMWKPRWIKTWKEKKVYVAVWKRMWGPVEVKEWVPIPKPPPGWVEHEHAFDAVVLKKLHH